MNLKSTSAVVLTASAILATAMQAPAQRPTLPRGVTTNAVPKAGTDALVTTDMSALTLPQLVEALLGPGVTASNVVLSGAPIAAGTFQGGLSIVSIDSGIVLSSGDIASVLGPNMSDGTSTINNTPGDVDLNALTTSPTFDACTLEFDFSCPAASQISFQYVFTSEEYNEYVNSQYNDVFGFFLNGVNIATLPGGVAVAINNVNCGNPYNPAMGGNCALYRNNSCADLGGPGTFPCVGAFDTEMDGLTVVLTATGTLLPGLNHIKLAVADAGDQVLDSNVFIRGQSFACGAAGAYFVPPTPCNQTFQALVGLPLEFTVAASAATGLPNNSVTLTAGALPTGVLLVPPLPQSQTGQNPLVSSSFSWTPATAQVGMHTLTWTATDNLSQSAVCSIHVQVVPQGSGLASSTVVGTGCIPSGQYPELRCDPPVLGTTVALEIEYGLPNWPAALLFSVGPPVSVQLWPGCRSYVDLAAFGILMVVNTDAVGRSNDPVPVPSAPVLVGMPLTLQGVFFGTSDPFGLRATDGLYLILGY
jgi:hypothetical protein